MKYKTTKLSVMRIVSNKHLFLGFKETLLLRTKTHVILTAAYFFSEASNHF